MLSDGKTLEYKWPAKMVEATNPDLANGSALTSDECEELATMAGSALEGRMTVAELSDAFINGGFPATVRSTDGETLISLDAGAPLVVGTRQSTARKKYLDLNYDGAYFKLNSEGALSANLADNSTGQNGAVAIGGDIQWTSGVGEIANGAVTESKLGSDVIELINSNSSNFYTTTGTVNVGTYSQDVYLSYFGFEADLGQIEHCSSIILHSDNTATYTFTENDPIVIFNGGAFDNIQNSTHVLNVFECIKSNDDEGSFFMYSFVCSIPVTFKTINSKLYLLVGPYPADVDAYQTINFDEGVWYYCTVD